LRLALQARYSSQPLNAAFFNLMSASVSAQYAAQVAAGKIERDDAQQAIVDRLAQLENALAERRLARKSSSLGWLFGSREAEPIKGLYIFGDVGRGKTMLMDMFFAASRVVRKRRVHFHEFMGEVHERIHALRQKGSSLRPLRRRHGFFASMNSTSPILPMR
jgi:cell division protein ZapE